MFQFFKQLNKIGLQDCQKCMQTHMRTCTHIISFYKNKTKEFTRSIDCCVPFTNDLKISLEIKQQVIKEQCTKSTMSDRKTAGILLKRIGQEITN